MKKIVALVLSLVMVLGLATTAFAAEDKYDFYLADDTMAAMMKLETPAEIGDDVIITEVPAKTNKDGSGNVAYLFVAYADAPEYGAYWLKTTAPTVESYAVCADGETDILFYVDFAGYDAGMFNYTASVTEFKSFSAYDKCGCVKATPAATDVYFETAKGVVYKAAATTGTDATANYLLNGKVVTAAAEQTVVDHAFIANNYVYDATLKTNVPTSALCTKCMTTTTAIYKDGKAPATSTVYDLTSDPAYCVVVGAVSAPAAGTTTGDVVESAKTFDAGIAMYVGMSVMAAAGSAVVLKKKD